MSTKSAWMMLATLVSVAGGCGGGSSEVIECTAASTCLKDGVPGRCAAAPSGKMYCAYPDNLCPSGERWGLFAGDHLANVCAASSDGGVDGAVGDGGSEARLELSPATQDFGPVVEGGSSVAVRFTVTNRGSQMSGTPMGGIGATNDFAIESHTCASALAPAGSCTFDVRFTPKAPGGVKSANLTVSGSPGGTTISALSGTGLTPGSLRLAPTQQMMGMVPLGSMSSEFSFTLTNTGGVASGIPTLTLLDTVNYTLTPGTCTAPVASGSACTFSVRFNPMSVGDKVTSVMVSAQPGGDSAVSLNGTGTATLTIMKQGSAAGRVTSAPAGIDCGATCAYSFSASPVTISAAPDATADFLGWSGAGCTGTAPCVIAMDTAKTVMATFETKLLAPRPVAPLSTATATSRRPTLRWQLGAGTDGARVEICAMRSCATTITSFDVTGTSGAPTVDLPRGVVFWRLYPRMGSRTGTSASPTWQITIGARTAPVNTSWGTTLDVNGDGFADVLVGAFGVNGSAGRAYVYLGGALGLSSTPAATLIGPDLADGRFGYSVASAGDTNGDGFADVVVGAYGVNSSAGRAYLYLGGAGGLSSVVGTTLVGPDIANGGFGKSVASAGDIDGDGFGDVIVGAGNLNNGSGRVYVYLGSAAGLSASGSPIFGSVSQGQFGDSVASAGDVNGDGFADVVVGAYQANFAGRAFLYHGASNGLSTNPVTTLTGPDVMSGRFGGSVASAGDVNGDGFADVVVGANGINTNAGRAYLYLGSASGLAAAPANTTLIGPDVSGGRFGFSVSGAGDLNADGYADVVVGAYGMISSAGRAYTFLGSASGLATSADSTLSGADVAGGEFGISVANGGDANSDGFADVVVGAHLVNVSAGRAYMYLGGAGGLPGAPSTTLTGPDVVGGEFGRSVW